jgi:hypothetical protein
MTGLAATLPQKSLENGFTRKVPKYPQVEAIIS